MARFSTVCFYCTVSNHARSSLLPRLSPGRSVYILHTTLRQCQNSSPKEPRKFKIKIEMTGEAKLLSSRAPLNRVVDSMDIDCPQSVEKPAGLFLETGERAAWERAADDDRDFAARSLNGDTALRGRV